MDDCSDVCGTGVVAPGLAVCMSVGTCAVEDLAVGVGWEVVIRLDRPGTGSVSDWMATVLLGSSLARVAVWLIVAVAGGEFCVLLSVLHSTIVVVSIISAKCIESHVNNMGINSH